MATREEIKEIVFEQIESATDGSVPEGHVSMEFPQDRDELPAVVYQDDYRPLLINGASASPSHVKYDGDDFVEYEEHREHIEGIFTISIRATNDDDAEEIYEQVHSAFGQYNFRDVADVKDLHEHIHKIEVQDVKDASDGESNVPARGDSLQVFVRFWRDYRVEDENIEEINQDSDVQTHE